MLQEMIYHDRIYIFGKPADILCRLAEHARRYTTVKELLHDLCPNNKQ